MTTLQETIQIERPALEVFDYVADFSTCEQWDSTATRSTRLDAGPLPSPEAPMGVEIETSKPGDGTTFPQRGQTVTVHYTGTLASDGSKFDSSLDRGSPFEFVLGQGVVIKGWDRGVKGMKVGGKRKLTIPPDLGYGERGFPPVIPANAVLVFEVELLDVR